MSDAHDHDEHGHDDEGGHEIDRMPNARLFNLLFGLSALTLLSCIGVIQLFNMQVDALEHSRAEQGSFRIHEYTDEMNKAKSGWGKLEIKELDDKNTTNVRYYMPVASAKKAMLEDPNLLKALPSTPGWKTADDRAPAAVPSKAVPTDGVRPPMPQPTPTPTPQPGPEGGAAKPPEPLPPADKPPGDGPPPKGDDAKGDDAKGDAKADEKPAPRKPKPAPRKPAPDAPPSPDGAP